MSIKEDLSEELKDAMRKRDKPRRDVIRQIETEVTMARSAADFSGNVDDDLYRTVISAYVKKMTKAVTEYRDLGERGEEMAKKLQFEIDYLSRWLPQQISPEETRRLVLEAIARLDVADDPKAAGRVIGAIMKEHRDAVDGGLVNRIVREELGA